MAVSKAMGVQVTKKTCPVHGTEAGKYADVHSPRPWSRPTLPIGTTIGMYMRNSSRIPKIWNDIRDTARMNELSEIARSFSKINIA